MTQKIIGGYAFREHIRRAEDATYEIKASLRQLMPFLPRDHQATKLIATASQAQVDILENLRGIEEISRQANNPQPASIQKGAG